MSSPSDQQLEQQAAQLQSFVPPPFPTWPPPSGGAPVTKAETGPITNPFPYGSTQPANISTANPSPPFNGIKYPQRYGLATSGQNQGAANQLPPTTKNWETGPLKADPKISAGNPAYVIGPGPQGTPPY